MLMPLLMVCVAAAPAVSLRNDVITAEFGPTGLARLTDRVLGQSLGVSAESATLTVAGQTLAVPDRAPAGVTHTATMVVYAFDTARGRVEVVYELRPGWRFVSKQLRLALPKGSEARIERVEVLTAQMEPAVAVARRASGPSGAVFLRLGEKPGDAGAFLVLQNPFLQWSWQAPHASLGYQADMAWRAADGPFVSDRVCLGLYRLSGVAWPQRGTPEWRYVPSPAQAFDGKAQVDWAETEAVTRCVEAFLRFQPTRSAKVHVPWCENDYQIDVSTPAGATEYRRIIDQAVAVGCDHTLFTPGVYSVSRIEDSRDAWGWENVLFLGLGPKVRSGEWKVDTDPIPAPIQAMLDYAKAKRIKLVAYAYPTLGFKQNPEWTAWCGGKTGGYQGVDTGNRSFQDWYVDLLVRFARRTGIGGYCFDHWWIAYEARDGLTPTSKYAQWNGCRRILEQLRERLPDAVIDGRQQYQWFGPWTWLAGTYPHPTTSDEQPGSFENFPDLHFDRVSGDRQRWAAWYYRQEAFAPLVTVPGYLTHQTPRNNEKGECVRDRAFRTRDWDLLGWKYSVLSSIGTAPFNHVVNLIPARDEAEFAAFAAADQRWLHGWLDWTDRHRALLSHLRPILGPPTLGLIDGTAAVDGDHGFVFLFNPNYRGLEARFTLDQSIGLTRGEGFVLREVYPRDGRLLAGPKGGVWHRGDPVVLPIKGPQAVVLELVPAAGLPRPLLMGALGTASLTGGRLALTNVAGDCGATTALSALLPRGAKVAQVSVNGRDLPFVQDGDVVRLNVLFAGRAMEHCPALGAYDPGFAGRAYRAEFSVPQRIFDQLARRRREWPVPYTADDLRATWLGSDRLLLYVHIADVVDTMTVSLAVDGAEVPLVKAYSDVYPLGRERTFTGFYADISNLTPDSTHQVTVNLPADLKPGQFQGLFLENVEAETTRDLGTTMVR